MRSAKRENIVFATERYAYLQEEICIRDNFEAGQITRKTFPDGERYLRVATECAGRDVILLGGTVDARDTLEIYDLACALVHRGIHTLTIAIPWFGYQTMERAVKPGEVVIAKTRARLLSSIPVAGSGNRVVMVDLHAEGIPHYFSGSIRPVHLYAKPLVLSMIKDLGGDDFVLGATDAGRAKWVESLANDLGVDAAFILKRRIDGSHTEVTALAADVQGRRVVIYDDMIRTGGSLVSAANSFKEAGASSISAVCTHGVLPGNAVEFLQSSGVLTSIACANTHPCAHEIAKTRNDDFLVVRSIADLLADCLQGFGTA